MKQFPDQDSCIAHLEMIRWGNNPQCPRCESENVARKTIRGKTGEWNCHLCKSTFNVMTDTMFQGTKVELHKWFLAIGLVANAKKSLSSHQLARDLDLTQPTALYIQQRIRTEMGRKSSPLLQCIIEADEAYVGESHANETSARMMNLLNADAEQRKPQYSEPLNESAT